MPSPLAFPDVQYDKCASLDSVELFELFLDDHIFKHIVEQSRLYRVSKNWPDHNISEEMMTVFLGILTVSGYNKLSSNQCSGLKGRTCGTKQCTKPCAGTDSILL